MPGLWLPANGGFGKQQHNVTAADRDGTTITAGGTAHTKGAFSSGELIASADEDAFAISIRVTGINVAVTDTSFLLDIGVGASGSERVLIADLDVWGGTNSPGSGKHWYFPVYIPKGQRIAARAQAVTASDVCNVAIWLHPACNGWGMEVPTIWECLGAISSSDSPSVTGGASSFGSWTTILDPITEDYKWWMPSMGGLNDTTITNTDMLVEVGYGDTSAAVTTIGAWIFNAGANESFDGPVPNVPVFWPLDADTTNGIFARTAGSTEARTVNVYGGR